MSSHHKKHSRDRAVTFSVLEETRSTSLRKVSVDLSSLSATDYTWNNLSMATRDYLGKYCLGPTQPGDSVESSKGTAEKKVSEVSNRSERSHSSLTSQGCTAPPCTPEATNKDENDAQILDIMRLKKLPKLFWQTCSATACRWRTFLPCAVVVYQVLCDTYNAGDYFLYFLCNILSINTWTISSAKVIFPYICIIGHLYDDIVLLLLWFLLQIKAFVILTYPASKASFYLLEWGRGRKALRELRKAFEIAEAQTSGLVNLVLYLYRQTGFSRASILLLINWWASLSSLCQAHSYRRLLETRTGAIICPANATGIVTRDAPVTSCHWPLFSLSLVNVPEVFANMNSPQFSFRF